MKRYRVRVASMTASYTGYVYADSEENAIQQVRDKYKRINDNRAYWNITAREVGEDEE